MKKVIYLVLIFSFFAILILIAGCNNTNPEVRIEAKFNNISAKQIDSFFANEVKDSLAQIAQLKDVTIFSQNNKCTVYCKISPFCLNKNRVKEKIERNFNFALNKTIKPDELYFDDEFDLKYDIFLIASTNCEDYSILRDFCDEISDELYSKNITQKISNLGEQEKAIYINFSNSALIKYNLSIEDIKKTIKDSNIIDNSSTKTDENYSYLIHSNGNLKNIDDIKNIVIPYQDNNFSIKFSDIFEIEEAISHPVECLINYNGKKAQILALSKRKFYPGILYQIKLKNIVKKFDDNLQNIDLTLIQTKNLNKFDIYLNERASIYAANNLAQIVEKKARKNKGERIYFIGNTGAKISDKEIYFENRKNRLTVFADKETAQNIKKILKEENIGYFEKKYTKIRLQNAKLKNLDERIEKTEEKFSNEKNLKTAINGSKKSMTIDYEIDNYSLNDYSVSTNDAINSILTNHDGLICDYFFEGVKRIPIILLNNNNLERGYIYNKKDRVLVYLGSIAQNSLKKDFCVIARNKKGYFSELLFKFETKNPISSLKLKKKLNSVLKD